MKKTILMLLLMAAGVVRLSGGELSNDEFLLESELLVSGPQVWLRLPYGSAYHPGALMVLEGRVVWPGGSPPQAPVGITIQEGEGPGGPRYVTRFAPGAAGAFRMPFQAPAGVADLRLSLWQEEQGETRDLFRASLGRRLEVLSAREQVVLRCGKVARLGVPPGWHVTSVLSTQLPEAEWPYDNVDVVILGSGAFKEKDASDAAVNALRNWVLGGGRLLIASAEPSSADVLDAANRAGLTPIAGHVPDRFPLWEGMRDEDAVFDAERHELVYARYRLGLGGGLLFLPFANKEAVDQLGMQALADPILHPPRVARSDARIWRQPFEFFAPGTVPPGRRNEAAKWALIGALCILLPLVCVIGKRPRYLMAGLSLAGVGLMASLLARTFPRPELTMARVELIDAASDGRSSSRTEWALCEGSWNPSTLQLTAPPGAAMSARHYSQRELRDTTSELSLNGGLAWGFYSDRMPPSAPLFACRSVSELVPAAGGPVQIDIPDEKVCLMVPRLIWREGAWATGTVWLRDDGRRFVLKNEGAAWTAERMPDETTFLRRLFPRAEETTVACWSRALSFVLDDAKAAGRVCLIRCADRLSGDPLISVQGAQTETGVSFSVLRIEVGQVSVQP